MAALQKQAVRRVLIDFMTSSGKQDETGTGALRRFGTGKGIINDPEDFEYLRY